MIKGSTPPKHIIILHTYGLTMECHNDRKRKSAELQGQVRESIVIHGDVNTHLSEPDPAGKESVRT